MRALLQRIFLTQGSNLGLPRCRQIPSLLSHQGSPHSMYLPVKRLYFHTVHPPNPAASSSRLSLGEGHGTQGERPAPDTRPGLPARVLSGSSPPLPLRTSSSGGPGPHTCCISYMSPAHCFQLRALTWFSYIFLCYLKQSLSSLPVHRRHQEAFKTTPALPQIKPVRLKTATPRARHGRASECLTATALAEDATENRPGNEAQS